MNQAATPRHFTPQAAGAALLRLAQQGTSPRLSEVQALLNCDPDWTTRSADGTAVHYAVANGHIGMLKLMLAHGAPAHSDLDEVNPPLHNAIMMGNCSAVQQLITYGAPLDTIGRDELKLSPLELAVQMDHTNQSFKEDERSHTVDMEIENHAQARMQSRTIIEQLLLAGAHAPAGLEHPLIRTHLRKAQACADQLLASTPLEPAKISAHDVCYFSNLGREGELFTPGMWQSHATELKTLLGDLPVWLADKLLLRTDLRELLNPPTTQIRDWSTELLPLSMPNTKPARA